MNEITISIDEYRMLIADKFEAMSFEKILRNKLECGTSLYIDEIKTICKLFGIEAIKDA